MKFRRVNQFENNQIYKIKYRTIIIIIKSKMHKMIFKKNKLTKCNLNKTKINNILLHISNIHNKIKLSLKSILNYNKK